jgi:hypothetical protein
VTSTWVSGSVLGALALIAGCNQSDRSEDLKPAGSSIQPADSVVLSSPSGTEVGFSLTRSSRSADGTPCTERGLVIRRDGSRIQVPLLYTGEAPTLLNDSTIRAVLWNNCLPSTAYLVHLRTGRPVPEREGNPAR